MVKGRLKDPDVATTLLPTFTTTTSHDRATAAIAFLGTMQEYFGYGIDFGCSFPSMTLLGEQNDWADMLRRMAWFEAIRHEKTTDWTWTRDVKHFWRRAVHEADTGMSGGLVTLSGWLTAFCWWGADGKIVQNYSDEELSDHGHEAGGLDG
ncbi:hypothetical protein N657DRAFT_685809 [Parathielavia appendiculata]|uniref:Uncharacterized protein n=1 Tax=Parathielavia appendiculata TaxID=2587402 RepID=A0AAN6Z8I8_9PEZI|nr:hypothetical protein N657DRAFT_685809 [Parathielavia appendiculata]